MIKPYIPKGFSSNCYLVADKRVALIDTGLEPEIEYIVRDAGRLDYIINTHCHFDHIGMNRALQEKFGAEIMMHKADAETLSGASAKDATAVNFFTRDTSALDFEIGRELKDKDTLDLGNIKLKVVHTPGHTRGSICLLADDALFSGDTVFSNGFGRTDLYGGSAGELKKSIEKLSSLKVDKIYPGHGEIVERSGAQAIKSLLRSL